MPRRLTVAVPLLLALLLVSAPAVAASVTPHGGMLRYPAVSATDIAFVYANDIWLVPRAGGEARPLASPPGAELFPRFSPDGKTIAFMGNYDGDTDLYVMPVEGGVPFRVTHHPATEQLRGFTPDGQLLFYMNGLSGLGRQTRIFTVSPRGGMPQALPPAYGANPAVSPNGRWLAFTPHERDFRTWKRYRGGMATDVWLFDLTTMASRKITDWEGTDTLPMWHGTTVYYLSDNGPEHKLNIWSYDTASGTRRQVTALGEYDVKFPSIGPGANGQGEIVFQYGASLYLLDLATGKAAPVEVRIPGARPLLRPHRVEVGKFVQAASVSPSGKRVALQARGDVWDAPAEKGPAFNLTRTSGVAERDPVWSPDGKLVAYSSDETGEYEIYTRPADGKGEPRRLTSGQKTFYSDLQFSPDSKLLAYSDKGGRLYLCRLESGKTEPIDTNPAGDPMRISFSHDSGYLAYARANDSMLGEIWLYEVANGKKTRVTSGMFDSGYPAFDREGKYLYFASARDFTDPIYEDVGTTFVYAGVYRLFMVPLRRDVASPFLPQADEEKGAEAKKEDGKDEEKKDEKKDAKDAGKKGEGKGEDKPAEPLKIDLDGFEERAIALPVDRGNFAVLAVNDKNQLVYSRVSPRGVSSEPAIHLFDPAAEPKERKEKTVLSGVRGFEVSADGKKLLVMTKERKLAVIEAKPDQKLEAFVPVDGLAQVIDPREEWRELFVDAWRRQRDYFYLENMHGVDWEGMRKRYEAMLADCESREDVAYVISEMISELNVGHAYYGGGDFEPQPSVTVGMLGADFELADGAYRIARIVEGGPWDVDGRGPLSQPGVDVKKGDFLLAVNGVPVDPAKDPWAAFVGLAGTTVRLTVSAKPRIDDGARQVLVDALPGEGDLRYRAWVEANRRRVAEASGGKIGYIHVPDTGVNGQNELFRQFYGQLGTEGLIVDDRWNGGGQIPTRFIELLGRKRTNYWARRDGIDLPWPPDAHVGPKAMLINGLAGSGGDAFPFYFKQAGLGPLIGTRTWGGLVGISGVPPLIDGGVVTVPNFGFYELDGTWGIEGHGVDPDVEVVDDPAQLAKGGDPQLEAAIRYVADQLAKNPPRPPKRPASPDRSGMGIKDADR